MRNYKIYGSRIIAVMTAAAITLTSAPGFVLAAQTQVNAEISATPPLLKMA